MRRRNQRLMIIGVVGAVLVLAAALTFAGLRNTVTYFFSPSELAVSAETGRHIRLGGLVVEGTVRREGAVNTFTVTDGATQIEVRYEGLLPDLFREGQGVVCEGRWTPGEAFIADRVLAKHDENYMPREVAEALKQRGEWKGGATP